MEFFACVLGGASVVAGGIVLFFVRPPDWQSDGEIAEDSKRVIARWSAVQRAVRVLTNSLIAMAGGGIMVAGFLPHGRVWMWLWAGVVSALLACIALAMLDALSSLASYRRAVPEAARRALGNDFSSELPLD